MIESIGVPTARGQGMKKGKITKRTQISRMGIRTDLFVREALVADEVDC
jgi:hypothetical protein